MSRLTETRTSLPKLMDYIVGWVDPNMDYNEDGNITGCYESKHADTFEDAVKAALSDCNKLFGLGQRNREVIVINSTDMNNDILTPLWSSRTNNTFDAKRCIENITAWIRTYFEQNASPHHKAVIGISGGKDSSIAAALCVKALGRERVYGVLMPQGEQSDINCSIKLVNHLNIDYTTINIGDTVSALLSQISGNLPLAEQAVINTPARIRMATLYAIAACVGGRVVNTCNLSEDWVGYSTKFGDSAGDFSPLSNFTVTELLQIGDALELPYDLVHKTPIDGLCGKSDEENLGFTYADLDRYIRGETDLADKPDIKAKIDKMYTNSRHKLKPMPAYKDPTLPVIPRNNAP